MTSNSEERTLRDFLIVLWSRRYVLILATGVAAALAYAASSTVSKQYRSSATLMITGSKVPTVSGGTDPFDSRLYADTYAQLIRSQSVAGRVIRELNLAGPPHALTEEWLTRQLDVRAVPGTVLLTVSLDFRDAAVAAQIVNAQTTQAVALSKSLATSDLADTRAYLKEQVMAAERELASRQDALRELKGRLRHEETTKQLEGMLKQRTTLEAALAKAEQSAAGSEAEVKAITKSLQGQDKVIKLNKSLVTDPALSGAVQAASGRGVGDLLGAQMRSEEINPLYAESEPALVRASADAAGFIARRDTVRRELTETVSTIQRLEHELADKSAALGQAQREHDLAKSTYENFAKSYENARLSVAARAAELKIVDPATPGLQPVSPNLPLNVVVATTTTFIVGMFGVLFLDYLRTPRRPVDEADRHLTV